MTLGVSFSHAQDIQPKGVKNLEVFERIAILDAGRVKPLDTYARNVLLQFSGHSKYKKESASHWLARHVFAPYSTAGDEIFLINHPDVLKALGIDAQEKHRFSFSALQGSLDSLHELARKAAAIDSKQRDAVESELIRLYGNVELYTRLSLSLSFVFPHEDFIVTSVGLRKEMNLTARQGGQYSFWDVALNAGVLNRDMIPLKRLPVNQWSQRQKETAHLTSNLLAWLSSYGDLPLSVVPSFDDSGQAWLSPWDAMTSALQNPSGREEFTAWRDMAEAFWKGEQTQFNLAAKSFQESVTPRILDAHPRWNSKSRLELFFNHLNPFFWARCLYLLVFILFLAGLIGQNPWVYKIAWGLMLAGFGLHTLGLGLRMIILERPPVSNLYETFIFVSFIGTIAGLIIEKVNRQWLGLLIASIAGTIFLWIAAKFAVEGDTLQMLVAVLNSNFWLSTHVLSITIGYSGMCVAGIVGHVYLVQRITQPNNKELLNKTYRVLQGTLGFGLTMTFLGTNLGGIWADQSWGRFWGWDPKENGALMIVIWAAILFHARMAGMIGPLGLAVGAAAGIIVVMWAWFGVNLLSVGLHSYGFTSGLAVNLMVYVIVQLLFLSAAVVLIKSREAAKY